MATMINNRIINEITRLKNLTGKFILDKSPLDGSSSNIILGRILPQSNIFNKAGFQIEIKLSDNYPFTPPQVRFITLMYHPNIGTNGEICLDAVLSAENYRPTTSLVDIVNKIIDIIDNPDLDHALNADIAAEYVQNRPLFDQKALDSVKKYGLLRQ